MSDEMTKQKVIDSIDSARATFHFMDVIFQLLKEHLKANDPTQESLDRVSTLVMFFVSDGLGPYAEMGAEKLTEIFGQRGSDLIMELVKRADGEPMTVEMVDEAAARVVIDVSAS